MQLDLKNSCGSYVTTLSDISANKGNTQGVAYTPEGSCLWVYGR
jgi:hypothetical protein